VSVEPLALSLATCASTLVGGLFTLRAQSRLRFVLAFTTGALLGIVSFDLLPDVFELTRQHGLGVLPPMLALCSGFLIFRSIENLMLTRGPVSDDLSPDHGDHRQNPPAGVLSALALIGHSVFDGVSIGLGFQVSTAIGLAVAIAVIGHDFADGVNTVSLMLAHGNSRRRAATMLVLDAVAPLVGAASTLLFRFPPDALVLYVGFFAGFLLHIATSASHGATIAGTRRQTGALVGLAWLGAAFALVVTQVAG
jgi:zinc transporter ZupT